MWLIAPIAIHTTQVVSSRLINRTKSLQIDRSKFVTETQKGFVPHALIYDCSMLLNLIEAYINDDPVERGAMFIFMDMEKAFDRVSYSFLNQGLQALGFGPKFRSAIHMMYNERHAPKRRLYVNGYYRQSLVPH